MRLYHAALLSRIMFTALPAVALSATVSAQCTSSWLPGEPVAGVNGGITAMTSWDPDGGGPGPSMIAVAGGFTAAGDVSARRIAAWDPSAGSWQSLADGFDANIESMATMPNGDLVVGGNFDSVDGVAYHNIARWNGSSWTQLGSGLSYVGGTGGYVNDTVVLPNGDLAVSGAFQLAGGVAADAVARWDGVSWSAMPGLLGDEVTALLLDANGDLVAATHQYSPATYRLSRWNGTTWTVFAFLGGEVDAMRTMPNGDLVAAGQFTWASPATGPGISAARIARWDGSTWLPLGSGLNNRVRALAVQPNGDLVVGGDFTSAGGSGADRIARWDGATWSPLASGSDGVVRALAPLPSGELLASGAFASPDGTGDWLIARWDGTTWSPTNPGAANGSQDIRALAALPNGDVVAVGSKTVFGGVPANLIARWDGTSWHPLGTGLRSGGNVASVVSVLPNGDVVAAGSFTSAGGAPAEKIARWDGNSWHPLGAGLSGGQPTTSAVLPNGDLVVAGSFTSAGGIAVDKLARWDGATWGAFAPGLAFPPLCLLVLANGDLVAGGITAAAAGNNVARWDGASWTYLTGLTNSSLSFASCNALAETHSGDLIAGGVFDAADGAPADNLARWDGSAWSPIGAGSISKVHDLTTLPNGEVIAVGNFTMIDGVETSYIASWDGTAWKPVDGGADAGLTDVVVRTNGELCVAGGMSVVGEKVSVEFACLASNCPATATPIGVGCTGSGGTSTLSATALPWAGGQFRAVGVGLASSALVLTITGFGPASPPLPLDVVFAQSSPSCLLHALPDVIEIQLTTTGVATSAVDIPASATLAGTELLHQMVALDVNPALQILDVTSTNALLLTVGAY